MKTVILILCFCLTSITSFAQVFDNFIDGDFLSTPEWEGDDSLFQVNTAFQLQSKATVGKDLSISTASTYTNGEWRFWCRFALSPSTSNFMRFYLISDSINLKGSVNGYYVQLGGITGNADSIMLFKQRGTTRMLIAGGRAATVSKANNIVRIKVLRDGSGNWELFADTTGGNNFKLEGVGFDNEFTTTSYVGSFIRFTAGNAQNYYLDDVYAGPIIVDTDAPVLDSVSAISSTQVRLVFNEPLNAISALDAANYTINNSIGTPLSAQFVVGRSDVVILNLNTPLTNNTYLLTANNVEDNNGNLAFALQKSFGYFVFNASVGDVLISEFFPDPSPVIGLPEQEFIELYNNTSSIISLQNWSISDASATAILPAVTIAPDSFIIICSNANIATFIPFGKIAAVGSLPSQNNSNDELILKDNTGKIIYQLSYDLTWYKNTAKSDGGFTIEMDNPKQLCLAKQNFGASDNSLGGTPGKENSRWNKLPDTTPPRVLSVRTISNNSLTIAFTERMDSSSFANATLVINPAASIAFTNIIGNQFDSLIVNFSSPLLPNIPYTISINGATDCTQNLFPTTPLSFSYFVPNEANQYDVLITELMLDPDPSVGLPGSEYIEIHNHSSNIISLQGWTLGDAGSRALLPDRILLPDSFLVFVTTSQLANFSFLQNVVGVSGFPSLGNDGDALTLRNKNGNVIHHLEYTAAAYRNSIKSNGGWSLELIDEKNPCGKDENLIASQNPLGGTPGKPNSVKGTKRDIAAPKLLQAYPISATVIELRFNEALDSTSQDSLPHYVANLGLGNPVATKFYPPSYQKVALTFADSLKRGSVYRIIANSIKDCAGNKLATLDYADIGLPELIDSGDIAINELLFDPRGSGSDFVELYNRTAKILDLKTLYLANTDDQNEIRDYYATASEGFLLFPKSFVVLTANAASIQGEYFTPHPERIVQCKMPAYSNDGGSCVIINLQGKRFDQLNYDDDMHFPLLDITDGVSLERIDYDRPSVDKSNWASASASSGYATPTYQNSQYASTSITKALKVEPETFSPDGDGFNDVLNFSYLLGEPGYTANFYLHNSAGKMIKHLLKNDVLGTSGVFSWDGIMDNGQLASIGIYLGYFEIFNLKGEVKKQRISFVVATKL